MYYKQYKFKEYELLYFGAYILFLLFSVLMQSFYFQYYHSLYKPMIVLCTIMLLFKEVISRSITKKTLWGFVILYVMAFVIIYRGSGSQQISLACAFLFIFGARNIKFIRICKITLPIMTFLLLFIIVSSFLGIIPNYKTVTLNRTREYLGFRYALYAPSICANIVFLIVYIRKEKIKCIEIVLLLVFSVFLYKKTDSRLTTGLSIVVLFLAFINKFRKDGFSHFKVLSALMVPSYIIACLVSIVLTINYNPSVTWMNKLNGLLGKRLEYGYTSIEQFGIRLLGNSDIEWIGNGLTVEGEKVNETYLYVDNLYVQVLQKYGIVYLSIYILLMTMTMYYLYKRKQTVLLIIMAFIAIHGIIDDLVLYAQYNTFLLLLGTTVFGNKRKENIDQFLYEKKIAINRY